MARLRKLAVRARYQVSAGGGAMIDKLAGHNWPVGGAPLARPAGVTTSRLYRACRASDAGRSTWRPSGATRRLLANDPMRAAPKSQMASAFVLLLRHSHKAGRLAGSIGSRLELHSTAELSAQLGSRTRTTKVHSHH